jgi:dTMP kinase
VLCDRYTDSTLAYQGGGKGVAADWIEALVAPLHAMARPDRTLLFDCPYEVSRARMQAAGRVLDRFEGEPREFFERVRRAYRDIAAREPERVRVIDGSRGVAEVRGQLQAALDGI